MQKRYFKLLPDLPFVELDGKTPIEESGTGKPAFCSHALFIGGRTIDPAFAGADPSADPPRTPNWSMVVVVSAETVRGALRDKFQGDWVTLDEDDFERLKRATEKGSYDPRLAGCLVPFMRAICDATTTKPEEEN